MNLNKGIIYVWKLDDLVVYVGRTIKTLDERINGHKREYLKQKEIKLKTHKFLMVNQLQNEWDDLRFEIIETLEPDRIDELGSRELFWYNHFTETRKLWNSIKPDNTDYLSLSLEARFERRKLKSFEKFLDKELRKIHVEVLIRTYEEALELTLNPISSKEFYINFLYMDLDIKEIYINQLNKHSKEKYFKSLLGWIIVKSDHRINFFNYRIGYFSYLFLDFIDLFNDIDFVQDMFDDVKSINLDELMNDWSESLKYLYQSKQNKIERYDILRSSLSSFEESIRSQIKDVQEVYNKKSMTYLNALGEYPLEDEAYELDEYDLILMKNVKSYLREFGNFISELFAFMFGSSIRGYNGDSIRTDYFLEFFGKDYIAEFEYLNFTDRKLKVIPKGYDLVYLDEIRGYFGIHVRVILDYDKYTDSSIPVFLNSVRSIPVYLRDDYNSVKYIVARDGEMLKYASERLKNDYDIVLSAIKNQPESICYASDSVKIEIDKCLRKLKKTN